MQHDKHDKHIRPTEMESRFVITKMDKMGGFYIDQQKLLNQTHNRFCDRIIHNQDNHSWSLENMRLIKMNLNQNGRNGGTNRGHN